MVLKGKCMIVRLGADVVRRRCWRLSPVTMTLLVALAVVLLALMAVQRVSAQAPPLRVSIRSALTSQPLPAVVVTLTALDGGTTTALSDDAGMVQFGVSVGSYGLSLRGSTLDGADIQLPPFYAARGGLPVFVLADNPAVLGLLVDADGIVHVEPFDTAPDPRTSGSQWVVPLTTTPLAPVMPVVVPTGAGSPALSVPPAPAGGVSPMSSMPTISVPVRMVSPSVPVDEPTIPSRLPLLLLITVILGIVAVWALRRSPTRPPTGGR